MRIFLISLIMLVAGCEGCKKPRPPFVRNYGGSSPKFEMPDDPRYMNKAQTQTKAEFYHACIKRYRFSKSVTYDCPECGRSFRGPITVDRIGRDSVTISCAPSCGEIFSLPRDEVEINDDPFYSTYNCPELGIINILEKDVTLTDDKLDLLFDCECGQTHSIWKQWSDSGR